MDKLKCIRIDYKDKRTWPKDNCHVFGFVQSNHNYFTPHWAILYVRVQYGHLQFWRSGKGQDIMTDMDKHSPGYCYKNLVTVTHYYTPPDIFKSPLIPKTWTRKHKKETK